jgi:Ca-activated chloride channel family protein
MRDRATASVLLVAALAGAAGAAFLLSRRYDLAEPRALWGLLLLPVVAGLYLWRIRRRGGEVKLPTLAMLERGPIDLAARLRHLPFAVALLGLGILIAALARPQSKDSWQDVTKEGIDIVIAMDFSASMLAKDFKPDRLTAAREVAMRFIDDRPNDRIGLVVYEGEAYTQCPLTTDHKVLQNLFLQAKSGQITGGTAVGTGLATAVNRLRESDARSKVVILLTDGVNNAGTIQPVDAAQIARQFGIRVYTIGVGSRGKALSPVAIYPNGSYKYDYVEVQIDEDMMQQVAELTDGRYYRAVNERKLRDIYAEIDKLEKTRVKVTEHSKRNEQYFPFVAAGAALLFLAFLLDRTLLRTTP